MVKRTLFNTIKCATVILAIIEVYPKFATHVFSYRKRPPTKGRRLKAPPFLMREMPGKLITGPKEKL